MRVELIVGARPNFMKAAPVHSAIRGLVPEWSLRLAHTGQHYDERMSGLFFRELGMPEPDVNFGIGSGCHAEQTAKAMLALESDFMEWRPDLVMVFGDVNSTLAAALAASKLGVRLAHVEAGLRSFDRTMPEEINRAVVDSLSDMLFTSERGAEANLLREGVSSSRIHFAGNTMIDSLLAHIGKAKGLGMPGRMGLESGGYALATLHRPANVDDPSCLGRMMKALAELSNSAPVLLPVHPRTARRIESMGIELGGIRICEPLGYLEFIGLLSGCAVVVTDSGGIQEESSALGVPCITMRSNTERPSTVESGTNILAGDDTDAMLALARKAFEGAWHKSKGAIERWDGKASVRIVETLKESL